MSGVGVVVAGDATADQVLAAMRCPRAATLWVAARGGFVPYVEATAVEAVNAPWRALFPGGRVPSGTALLVRCN